MSRLLLDTPLLLFCPSAPIQDKEKDRGQAKTLDGSSTSGCDADGVCRGRDQTGQGDTLGIISLNVKNLTTNLNFVKDLSKRFPIIFLQETWFYRYEANMLAEVFDNTEFVCGCSDDDVPVAPSLQMRDYGGTSILWILVAQLPKLPYEETAGVKHKN